MKATTATYTAELDRKVAFTDARCREKGWWHAWLYIGHMRLILTDLFGAMKRSAHRAKLAAEADISAALLIRKAMSDGLTEHDRAALDEALLRIEASARHDEAVTKDLTLTP